MDTENQIIETWNEIKTIMNELELHIVKNARGVAAAGVRARKGLRAIKAKASQLVKMTVDLDKAKKGVKEEGTAPPVAE